MLNKFLGKYDCAKCGKNIPPWMPRRVPQQEHFDCRETATVPLQQYEALREELRRAHPVVEAALHFTADQSNGPLQALHDACATYRRSGAA